MTKTVARAFGAWAFSKNAADLNRRSEQGWNLKKAGWCRYTFERSDTVFRYGLDYCPAGLGHEEWERRIAAYGEQGWELINITATGWSYFRKAYDPALPEEAYVLKMPYNEDQLRLVGPISVLFWVRILILIVGLVLAVMAMVKREAMVLAAVIYLICMLMLFFRIQALQEKLK